MKTKNISKFVLKFIQENKDKDKNKLVEEWNSEKNLSALDCFFNKKKVIDENKPKRGKSSYLHFCDDYRASVKEKFPDYTNKQILNHLGNLWKNLKVDNPKIVEKYENIAKEERDKYKEKMTIYKSSLPDTQNNKETSSKEKSINLNAQDIDLILSLKKELEKIDDKVEDKVDDKVDEKIDDKVDDKIDEKAFARFLKKRKNKFIDEYPELDSDQIFAKMKKKWASFSDEKKQKYIK